MLALKNPGTHIPYRESALTSVLRRSLVARCRTVFVITLNLDVEDLPEAAASCRWEGIRRTGTLKIEELLGRPATTECE